VPAGLSRPTREARGGRGARPRAGSAPLPSPLPAFAGRGNRTVTRSSNSWIPRLDQTVQYSSVWELHHRPLAAPTPERHRTCGAGWFTASVRNLPDVPGECQVVVEWLRDICDLCGEMAYLIHGPRMLVSCFLGSVSDHRAMIRALSSAWHWPQPLQSARRPSLAQHLRGFWAHGRDPGRHVCNGQ